LQIEGKVFPVDLTWDSGRFQRGEKGLEYFGCKKDFLLTHKQDADEKQYGYVRFSPEAINKIDTNNIVKQRILSEEDKKQILQNAIEETYKKFKLMQDSEKAKSKVKIAIMKYIKEGRTDSFTRQNNARAGIEEHITREDMMNLLIKEYVTDTELAFDNNYKSNDVLASAIYETSNKYGKQHTNNALRKYILENNMDSFTRQNGARKNIDTLMSPQLALEKMIREMVDREVTSIEKTEILKENNTQALQKEYFDASELEKVGLPPEKEKGLIKKATEWIKRKTIERRQNKNIEKENIQNSKQIEEIREQNER